jgi:hypothetical protein
MIYSPAAFHAWMTDVKEITLYPVRPDQDKQGYLLQISVRTSRGECFDLLLHAPKKESLAFRDPPDLDDIDWMDPQI